MSQLRKRLLVVGGTGFIGQHILQRACSVGLDVTSLSLRSNPTSGLSGVRYLVADTVDLIALKETLGAGAFEYVVNCGGYIDHALFKNGGRRVMDVHFNGVCNLVDALDRSVLESFVNIGSSDEYGNADAPQAETLREAPISPYSMGKVAATHFLQMLHGTETFPATTLRLFLTYGPGQDKRRFLPQIILGCLQGRSFPTSYGEQLRDFCFVGDTVDAVFAALSNRSAHGQVVNIASGQAVTIRRMIETVQQLIGKGEPRFGEVAYRPGENMQLFADVSRARKVLDWAPKISLESGLAQTIQYFRTQQ